MYNAIKRIYPLIDDDDFDLQDNSDGNGVFIASWRYVQPKPTNAQIAAVIPDTPAEEKRALLAPLDSLQLRDAFELINLLTPVEAAVALGGKKLKREWEFRLSWRRDNVTLRALATAQGMTEAQLDTLFTVGATL